LTNATAGEGADGIERIKIELRDLCVRVLSGQRRTFLPLYLGNKRIPREQNILIPAFLRPECCFRTWAVNRGSTDIWASCGLGGRRGRDDTGLLSRFLQPMAVAVFVAGATLADIALSLALQGVVTNPSDYAR
jgi:hypothetical protein